MSDNYQASCACGKVHFVLDGEPHLTINCHCTVCRKMNGSAFSTYSVFSRDDLRITAGAEDIQTAGMGEHGTKHFCRHCGSPLYGLHRQAASICMVVLGAIDTGGAILPIANVFCRSKLPWSFEIGKMINHEINLPG
jgi:hypothetical protein